jgi:hypothetical protein
MILWRFRGVTSKDVVCEIEKHPGRYRLVVKRGDEVMLDEAHASIEEARTRAQVIRKKLESIGSEGTPLTVLTPEPAWRRSAVKMLEVEQPYTAEEWNRWSHGDRSGFPVDKRLAYNHDDGFRENSFCEAMIAGRFARGGFVCWSYYTLLTPTSSNSPKFSNGEGVRDHLRKARVDLNLIPQEVEGIERVRDPYLLVYWPHSRRRWMAWEVVRDDDPLGFDRLASLALFHQYLNFFVGVFRFVRTPRAGQEHCVQIEEFTSGKVRVSVCSPNDPLRPAVAARVVG